MMPKRCLPFVDEHQHIKRPRLFAEGGDTSRHPNGPEVIEEFRCHQKVEMDAKETSTHQYSLPTLHHQVRCGLHRSIAIILSQAGYESAHYEALEGLTEMAELYMSSIIEEIKRLAIVSRRESPNPEDFEIVFRHFNLPTSSLKPHLRYLTPILEIEPDYIDQTPASSYAFNIPPLLGQELSGHWDKIDKCYIPASFPDFPSTHTYKFTPPEETGARDSKKIRQEAARNAQQGEAALRKLVRASKMRKQKEVKSLVECDTSGKERFRLWESTMTRFMTRDEFGDFLDQVEIADHSMLVNGDINFSRKEVSRFGKRSGTLKSQMTS